MTVIDKRMLVDTVTIKKLTGETDVWGKVTYDEPTTLKPVRFDRQFNVSGSTNNRSESKPSVLFVYPKYCPVVLDESFENGLINDGERDYKIRSVIPVYYPRQSKVFCYEIEVI